MMQQESLNKIVNKYKTSGFNKGAEFLLPPKSAVQFISELGGAGIVILGITTWNYVDPQDKDKGIIENLAYEYDVDEEVLQSKNASHLSAEKCIIYINEVSEITDFVSADLYAFLKFI